MCVRERWHEKIQTQSAPCIRDELSAPAPMSATDDDANKSSFSLVIFSSLTFLDGFLYEQGYYDFLA